MRIINIEYLLNMNKAAFCGIRKGLKAGMTEKDAYSIIIDSFNNSTGLPYTVEGDVIGGIRSSGIEGSAADLILKDGDCLILDIQPMIDGVFCDTTRTFFIGNPDDEKIIAYNAVRQTLEGLEEMLSSGTVMSDIFDRMQELLGKHGFSCPHHAGHLIGKNRSITPDFVPEEKSVLEVGDLVALEPGVYFEGRFGIRLENNYLITEKGCKSLFDFTLDINNFIL